MTYSLGEPDPVANAGIKSGGVDVVWDLVSPTVLEGKAGGEVVIRITITDASTGDFQIELIGPFDHPASGSEDNLAIVIPVTVEDPFGGSKTANMTVVVEDDSPVIDPSQNSSLRDWTLDDDQLAKGNDSADNPADTNDYTALANKPLGVAWGADGAKSLTIGAIVVADQDGNPVAPPLSSGGVELHYETVTNGDGGQTLTAYKGAGGPVVFTLTLDPDADPSGAFSFEYELPLDHPDADGQNRLDLTFGFTATDGDNDPVSSNIVIRIVDDVPVIDPSQNSSLRDWTLDDDRLAKGNDSADNPADTNDYTALANKPLGVAWGADGAKSLTIGAIVVADQDGNPVAPPLSSGGVELHYETVTNGDGGQTLTAYKGAGGPVVFTLTLDPDADPSGAFSFEYELPLDHPDADGQNRLDLTFGFTATDGDNDPVSSNIVIRIVDDVPVANGQAVSAIVDEDDIDTPWSEGTSPNDGNADGSLTDGSGAAVVSGSLAGIVSAGADEPVTFGLAANAVAYLEGLGLFSKENALPENGLPLSYVQTSTATTVTISGFEPDTAGPGNTGNPVFSLTIDTTTGAYEFKLFDELIHKAPESGADENFDLRSGDGGATVPSIDFGSIVTVTDKDGDTITLDGKFTIEVRDDIPVADIDLVDFFGADVRVQHDETAGNQNGFLDILDGDRDTGLAIVKAAFAALEAGGQTGNDPDVAPVSGAIGYAVSTLPVVTNDSEIGADSPPLTQSFSLAITNANSGLSVTDGSPIVLENIAGLIVGRVDGGTFDGQIAFAVGIGSEGHVAVAQYLSLLHPNSGSNDKSVDLSGNISAVLTVTDSDGDTATDSVDIGARIRFDDDGPSVGSNGTVRLDDDDLVPNGNNNSSTGDDAAPS